MFKRLGPVVNKPKNISPRSKAVEGQFKDAMDKLKKSQVIDELSIIEIEPEQSKTDVEPNKNLLISQVPDKDSIFAKVGYGKATIAESMSKDIGHEIVYGFGTDYKPRAKTDLQVEERMRVMNRVMHALQYQKSE